MRSLQTARFSTQTSKHTATTRQASLIKARSNSTGGSSTVKKTCISCSHICHLQSNLSTPLKSRDKYSSTPQRISRRQAVDQNQHKVPEAFEDPSKYLFLLRINLYRRETYYRVFDNEWLNYTAFRSRFAEYVHQWWIRVDPRDNDGHFFRCLDVNPAYQLQPVYSPVPLFYEIDYIMQPSLFIKFIHRNAKCSALVKDLELWKPDVPRPQPPQLQLQNNATSTLPHPSVNISLGLDTLDRLPPATEPQWIRALRDAFNAIPDNGVGSDSRMIYFYSRAMVTVHLS